VTTRLKNNGLTFHRAFTCTAMCTASRNTMFTGLFPAQHGSTDTLTEIQPQQEIEHQLDPTLPNLATCLKEAGYDVIYKGKWHMSAGVESADGTAIPDDIARYGFDSWDAPDAGGDTQPSNFGGGTADHDQRFVNDAISFLQSRMAGGSEKPFCLVVSLVNPHDVLAFPSTYKDGGYPDDPWLNPTTPAIEIPPTESESLLSNKKPTAQRQVLTVIQLGLGPLLNETQKKNYLNFYGNLMREVDGQIGQLLNVFDSNGSTGQTFLNNTLIIRTSDHGEMGLCHGGLRQKTFVTYEETIRVPLIWSNPQLYPTAKTTNAMVSHVDLLPTLCSLAGVPNWQAKGFKGVDYSSIVLDPSAPPVQNYVLFTFDDIYAASDRTQFPNGVASPPNRIQMIRTADFKYNRYYDKAGVEPDQGEFYDLRSNGGDFDAVFQQPLEMKNLSVWASTNFANPPLLTPEQLLARTQMAIDLENAVNTRLQPRPKNPPVGPQDLKVEVVRWSDENGPHAQAQITFLTRFGETYQLQQSTDLLAWSDVDSAIPGNNGPILRHYDLIISQAFYRIKWTGPA
jgi:arylsulfatase A-like enzyme